MKAIDIEQLKKNGRRLRTRRIDEKEEAKQAALAANFLQEIVYLVNHGGSVSGKYGHPAETEGLVTVAFPNGYIYQRGARLSASNPTKSGVIAACLGDWARPVVDPRYDDAKKKIAKCALVAAATEALQELDSDFESETLGFDEMFAGREEVLHCIKGASLNKNL
jgi:hypothetical protein